MSTTQPPAQASDEQAALSKQLRIWRAEVARLNDLIAHASGAQASDEPMRAAKPGDTCGTCSGTGCEHCDYTGIEPRKIVGYGDCRCILSKYCDGCCNPIWADQAAIKGAKP